MYEILRRESLNPTVTLMEVAAPAIAAKARPGQFVILRVEEEGERIPLTVAGYDRSAGWVRIIFQTAGATTLKLSRKQAGDRIQDMVGPLGRPTELEGLKKVCVIGGGVGCAIAYPVAEALKQSGAEVTSIVGFRNRDLVILEEAFRQISNRFILITDDGSAGEKGNICLPLQELLNKGEVFDRVLVFGPLIMMKFAVETLRPTGIPCTVSMNPIMIDGTGMCGGCRLSLTENGRRVTRFACVDGPEFDGYTVDFDEAMSRGRMYADCEHHEYETACNLFRKEAE